MKKIKFIVLFLLLPNFLFSQQNDLMPESILFESGAFFFGDTTNLRYMPHRRVINNEQHTDKFIGQILLENALNNKIDAYSSTYYSDFYPYDIFQTEKIDITEIKESLGSINDTTLRYNSQRDTLEEVVVKGKIDYREIKGLLFIEDWIYNAEAFTFNKNIKAIVPVRAFYKYADFEKDQVVLSKVCHLLYPEKLSWWKRFRMKKRLIHCNTITYECPLFNTNTAQCSECFDMDFELEHAPYFNSLSRLTLVRSIIDPVLEGKRKAYTFYPRNELSVEDVKDHLGGGVEEIMFPDENGEVVIQKIERDIPYYQIKSVLFFEDWYYDPKTLRMKKVINGIAPVRHYYKQDDYDHENLVKRIAFVVKIEHE